jgi:hypothetical protein
MTKEAQRRKEDKREDRQDERQAARQAAPPVAAAPIVPARSTGMSAIPQTDWPTDFSNTNQQAYLQSLIAPQQTAAGGSGFDQFMNGPNAANIMAEYNAARIANPKLDFNDFMATRGVGGSSDEDDYRLYWGEQNPQGLFTAKMKQGGAYTATGGTNFEDYVNGAYADMKAIGYNEAVERDPSLTWRAYLEGNDPAAEARRLYPHIPSSIKPPNPFVGGGRWSMWD